MSEVLPLNDLVSKALYQRGIELQRKGDKSFGVWIRASKEVKNLPIPVTETSDSDDITILYRVGPTVMEWIERYLAKIPGGGEEVLAVGPDEADKLWEDHFG